MTADGFLGDVLGTDATRCPVLQNVLWQFFHVVHLGDYLAYGLGNFPTAAVAQGHHHGHGIVTLGAFLGLEKLLLHLIGQTLHVTYHTETHVMLHEDLILQRSEHQSHQCRNLV